MIRWLDHFPAGIRRFDDLALARAFCCAGLRSCEGLFLRWLKYLALVRVFCFFDASGIGPQMELWLLFLSWPLFSPALA